MRTRQETRLECVRLANALATAKVVPPAQIVGYAMEFYKWVDDAPDEDASVSRLADKFRVR